MTVFLLKHWPKIAIGLAVIAAFFWVRHEILEYGRTQFTAGVTHEQARITKKVERITAGAARISTTIRSQNNEEVRHITAAATGLLVHGPGKAACPAVTLSPASGHEPAAGQADAPLGGVPDSERPALIALPFIDLVNFAKEHDLNLGEVKAWRKNDELQNELIAQESK